MPVVFNSHVGNAGLVMRRRVVMLDAHQVRMPYMRGRVVDAGGVIVTMKSERGGLGVRDGELVADVDYLRSVMLTGKKRGLI